MGRPIGSVRKAFKAACRRAGIKNMRFHDLRHTFATRLVLSGVDLATVSKLLGHSSIQMTMRYSHPTPEALKNAVSKLDK
jgi:integrase